MDKRNGRASLYIRVCVIKSMLFIPEYLRVMAVCLITQSSLFFLSGVLPGRFCRGAEGLVEPPALDAGCWASADQRPMMHW